MQVLVIGGGVAGLSAVTTVVAPFVSFLSSHLHLHRKLQAMSSSLMCICARKYDMHMHGSPALSCLSEVLHF